MSTLSELRERIGAIDGSAERARTRFSLFRQGFPLGAISELTGFGKTEFLSQFLRENPLKTAWIEPRLTINPYALYQRGVDIQKILFLESEKDFSWAVQQVLRSQTFQAVILSEARFMEKELRRLQLLTERVQGHLFFLSETLHQSWVPALQMEVTKKGDELAYRVVKQRGRL